MMVTPGIIETFLQADLQYSVSFLILLIMSAIALAISFLLYSKFRIMTRLPSDLPLKVFNKTFNVFNPYPEQRKVIHKFIFLIPVALAYGSFILATYVAITIVEMELVTSFLIFIFSAALIVVEEPFAVYRNANIFIKAVKSKVDFGKGDLDVFLLVKQSLPKLSRYYLFLTVLFFAGSVSLSYWVPLILSGFASFARAVIYSISSFGFPEPFAFLFTTIFFISILAVVQFVIRRIKHMIFDLPTLEQ
jgi:hypothetical protein